MPLSCDVSCRHICKLAIGISDSGRKKEYIKRNVVVYTAIYYI